VGAGVSRDVSPPVGAYHVRAGAVFLDCPTHAACRLVVTREGERHVRVDVVSRARFDALLAEREAAAQAARESRR